MHLSLARSAAAPAIHPLSLPSSSAKVGEAERGAQLGKVRAGRSFSGFLEGTHRLTSEVRGHLAVDSASRAALGAVVAARLLVPGRSEAEDPARKSQSLHPQPPWACSCSHFHKGPAAFVRHEELPSGTPRERRHPPRCDRDPGVLPALPSANRGAQDCSLPCSAAVSELRASLGLSLRGTRDARGAGFHRHSRGSRVLAPLLLRGRRAPDTRERSAAPESRGRGMVRLARGSLVGSEPGAAENA